MSKIPGTTKFPVICHVPENPWLVIDIRLDVPPVIVRAGIDSVIPGPLISHRDVIASPMLIVGVPADTVIIFPVVDRLRSILDDNVNVPPFVKVSGADVLEKITDAAPLNVTTELFPIMIPKNVVALSQSSTPAVLVFIVIAHEVAVTVPKALPKCTLLLAPFAVIPFPQFSVPDPSIVTFPLAVRTNPTHVTACVFVADTVSVCRLGASAKVVPAVAVLLIVTSYRLFPFSVMVWAAVPEKVMRLVPGSTV